MKRVLTLTGLVACTSFLFSNCTKKNAPDLPPSNENLSATEVAGLPDSMMVTPFGVLPKSQVHHIEDGATLQWKGDHLLMLNVKTRSVLKDFGVQHKIQVDSSLSARFNVQRSKARQDVQAPVLGSGWITFAQNDFAMTMSQFTTQFVVPSIPTTYHGQLLYLFNGVEDASHILQPVLQFGNNNAWGGNYWTIDNWYASCQSCSAFYGTQVSVPPGTLLEGKITQDSSGTPGFVNAQSTFTYITINAAGRPVSNAFPASNGLSLANVPELPYLYESMEAYNMQVATDYPADRVCKMTNIGCWPLGWKLPRNRTDPYPPQLSWSPYTLVNDIGQHTVIVSPLEVDLYFRP